MLQYKRVCTVVVVAFEGCLHCCFYVCYR
jgi:hypothetical protein